MELKEYFSKASGGVLLNNCRGSVLKILMKLLEELEMSFKVYFLNVRHRHGVSSGYFWGVEPGF